LDVVSSLSLTALFIDFRVDCLFCFFASALSIGPLDSLQRPEKIIKEGQTIICNFRRYNTSQPSLEERIMGDHIVPT
jgi:hypothetical protein